MRKPIVLMLISLLLFSVCLFFVSLFQKINLTIFAVCALATLVIFFCLPSKTVGNSKNIGSTIFIEILMVVLISCINQSVFVSLGQWTALLIGGLAVGLLGIGVFVSPFWLLASLSSHKPDELG